VSNVRITQLPCDKAQHNFKWVIVKSDGMEAQTTGQFILVNRLVYDGTNMHLGVGVNFFFLTSWA